MNPRILPILVAAFTLALWPQGVILCASEDGHVEVELDGAGCCSPDSDDDCADSDCSDFSAPDRRVAPGPHVLAPPASWGTQLLPDFLPRASESVHTPPLLPPRESTGHPVILIV